MVGRDEYLARHVHAGLARAIPGAIDAIANAASNAAKGQVEAIGSGAKRKAGRPRKGRGGGALFPAGNYGPND